LFVKFTANEYFLFLILVLSAECKVMHIRNTKLINYFWLFVKTNPKMYIIL